MVLQQFVYSKLKMTQRDKIMALKQESPDLFFFEATGFNMWPFLRSKDKLIVKKTSFKDLKIGDIILYVKSNQLVCHRLVKKIKGKQRYLLYSEVIIQNQLSL